MREAIAIVLAAGSGDRLGLPTPKAFVPLGGRPLLARAVAAALACRGIGSVAVTAPAGSEDLAHSIVEPLGGHAVVTGGPTRHASVRAALAVIPPEVEVILCHDAARALASPELFAAVIEGLARWDGVVPVVPVPDTVKRVREGAVVATEPREDLALVQTPQAFRAAALRDAHARSEDAEVEFTDDAAALEWAGYRVGTVPGEPHAFKITTAEDLSRAERLLEEAVRG
ncbi:MAG TPA: 2-C-methyl-D-erythritol 4-phosphate cytidylyltransferase [Actinomycetota bacterium]|nr:2-C-methyl-D-erythritol 4-phosphate cytidylyltransferase [Actinomycetota bacterium]